MNITVVGLGLIGASLAKAIKKHTSHNVFGIDLDESVLNKAKNDDTIDEIGNEETLAVSDVVIVSIYPLASIDFVKNNAKIIKKGALVIDTCGTKRQICSSLCPIAKENGFEFLGAHPMAGKEKNGYDYSEAELFANAFMILTPTEYNSESAIEKAKNLAKEMHFKNVTISTPLEHDRIIAYTSQIPHVLACAYINDPDAIRHDGFSAGSYKDISRVADINAALWQELFIENKDCLSSHIDMLINNLSRLKEMIENDDNESLTKTLQNARETKLRIG